MGLSLGPSLNQQAGVFSIYYILPRLEMWVPLPHQTSCPLSLSLSLRSVFPPTNTIEAFQVFFLKLNLLYFTQAVLTFKIQTLEELPDILHIFLDIQGLFPLGKNIQKENILLSS